ncbi:MAG: DUF5916 domain-containing protein [Ignavibacteriales bacterium]
MKKIVLTLAIISLILPGSILNASSRAGKRVRAVKSIEEIKIDGLLNEKIWHSQPIEDFTQKDPKEGEKASERTCAWIAYDESNIYIAAKLYDSHPDSIVGRLARRDNRIDSDWFGVAFDPYMDKRTGFYFLINPSETVADGVFYNDGWEDPSWDGVWFYAARADKDGWNVEMKIPFTQLRYKHSEEMNWGVNLYRKIQRRNEEDYYEMVPKKESGFVSHFPELTGLNGVEKKQRLEILPYIVSKSQYLVHDEKDPFYKGNQYKLSFGGDLKVGLGSNLTLDATFNPDFGQVEVDPAVVNLSAFETFYDEKRPFFIEGTNILSFGYGGANDNWNFNWGSPDIFYSRRIGRTPQGEVNGEPDYEDLPKESRILGAAKLTGKIADNWSLGVLDAVTQRTFAQVDFSGVRSSQEMEPLTNYAVIRSQKEFSEGRQALGFIFTSVNRDLKDSELRKRLSERSNVLGVDGWTTFGDDDMYVLTGNMSGSYVHGTSDYLTLMQESPLRYMQRPDATYARLDSSLTSMTGWMGRVSLNKQKGNFYLNAAVGAVSPGFEANDAGFQWRADLINSHLLLGYRWFSPDEFLFRSKQIYISHFRSFNFEGNPTTTGYFLFTRLQFLNYYGLNLQGVYCPRTYNMRLTRGGPMVRNAENYQVNVNGYTDSRKNVILNVADNYGRDELGSWVNSFSTDVEWRPASRVTFSIGPSIERNYDRLQWIDKFTDAAATYTYGARYVLGEMNQTTIAANIRLNWTFSSTLSLQMFFQPLISSAHFENFKEVARPRSLDYNAFSPSSVKYDAGNDEYTIDPGGNGVPFTFSNPDFNYKSLRGNLVLRWEFLPGSSLYLVWTQSKENEDNPGYMSFGRDFRNLLNSEPNNIFLMKFTYWLNY